MGNIRRKLQKIIKIPTQKKKDKNVKFFTIKQGYEDFL